MNSWEQNATMMLTLKLLECTQGIDNISIIDSYTYSF